ncbi:hypothetical protein GVN16_14640 [Emticicia sp. CRIBPO]|uniref:hypothetical protein n=1 Tax=Emticicia sp. CRIBPO TaxID=2683258 RepID=UPI0014136167|nr:hypothetical protein [Emticicia sp. CRIBPO]NBA87007.1 hypothetical protein [Emticicia sp. CRIBPO]
MKTYYASFALLIGCCFSSCQTSQSSTPFDEEKAKAEIMATIQEETDCFFRRDYNCWQDKFVHNDYAYQAWSNSDGTFDASVGWNAINNNLGKYIKENPEEKEAEGVSSHPVVKRENLKVRFFGNNTAHLTWDQFNSDSKKTYYLHSKEVRLMEKADGKWKIVNVSAFWNYKNKIPFKDKM